MRCCRIEFNSPECLSVSPRRTTNEKPHNIPLCQCQRNYGRWLHSHRSGNPVTESPLWWMSTSTRSFHFTFWLNAVNLSASQSPVAARETGSRFKWMTSSRQIRAACAKGSREEKTKQPKRIYPSFSFFLRGIRKKSLLTGRKVICVGGRHSLPCAAVLVGNDWPGVQKTLTNTQQAFLLVPRVLERPRPPSMNTKKKSNSIHTTVPLWCAGLTISPKWKRKENWWHLNVRERGKSWREKKERKLNWLRLG